MRTLLALSIIVLLGASGPVASPAAALQLGSEGSASLSSLTDSAELDVAKKSKNKKKNTNKKKKKKKPLVVTLDEIDSTKKGRRGVEVTGRLSGDKKDVEYTCELVVTFADGTTEETDREPFDEDDECSVEIDVPNDGEVVGDAEVEMVVRNEDGKRKASDKKTMVVRSGR